MLAFKRLGNMLTEAGYCSPNSVADWICKLDQNSGAFRLLLNNSHITTTMSGDVFDTIKAFAESGIVESDLLSLLASSEARILLAYNRHTIDSTLDNLRSLGFDASERARLLIFCPNLPRASTANVFNSYTWLRQTFTDRQARRLALFRPVVLATDKAQLENRAHYLFARMRIIAREVAHSGALSHSVEHIRCRHLFLLRSGQYEFPDTKARIHRLAKNPTPKDIFDTSENDFVLRIARLSLQEYFIFKKLLSDEHFEDEDL